MAFGRMGAADFGRMGSLGGAGTGVTYSAATVSSYSPLDNATGVSLSTALVVTFSETVTLGTGTVNLYKTSDNSLIESWDAATEGGSGAGQIEVVTNTSLTMHLTSNLANSIEYYVLWNAGVVVDGSANPIVAQTSTTAWSFTTTSSFTGLLDTYPTASMAYSFRKLRNAYAGSAVRIRRSSDNAEANIGFDGSGNFDSAAAAAHIGGGSGFIVTWFDQSGNARDATNATVANQPTYNATGLNSKPTMAFDGTNDRLATATLANTVWPTTMTMMAAAQDQLGTASTLAAWDINGATFSSFWQIVTAASVIYWDYGNTTSGRVSVAVPSGWTTTPHLWEFGHETGLANFITIDAVELVRMAGRAGPPTSGTSPVYFGSSFSANYFNGIQSEFVFWAADLAGSRAAARATIKAYWGTP